MTDLIDSIGPFLGVAAFLGLAILAFLTIQQAREVRRLREWVGRAPERAQEAAEAEAAVTEAKGEEPEPEEAEEEQEEAPPSRAGAWLRRRREWAAGVFAAADRRLPVDPRYLIAVIAAAVIAAGVLTSGFGLFGDDDAGAGGGNGGGRGGDQQEQKVEVAVLNATQEEAADGTVIAGVQGLADVVAKEVINPLKGFGVGEKADATSGFDETTVMFERANEEDATELAGEVTEQLGEPEVLPMIDEVRERAAGASLALVVGRDDADFGS